MSVKSEFNVQLEAYFSGEMKGADRLVFEGRVESDPMLKSEFDHQNDIVETLKAHRSAELKTRLSNIPVDPSFIGSMLQSSLIKPVTYAITGLIVATGSYLFFNQEEAIQLHIDRLDGKREFITASNLEMNKDLVVDFKYVAKQPVLEDNTQPVENSIELVPNEIAFEVPNIGNDMNADEFRAPGLSIAEAKKIEQVPSLAKLDKIQINTISSRRFGFHYRIEDNRLFLYGKFNESPYEIIELNTPQSKSLFFYYDGSFYNLNKGANSITPLSRIEDNKLVNKLTLLKEKSSQ